jgi:hypothetical protein
VQVFTFQSDKNETKCKIGKNLNQKQYREDKRENRDKYAEERTIKFLLHLVTLVSVEQCFSNFWPSQITSQAVGAHTDHLCKIPHT